MTLNDDTYNYIISGDFKPEDDPSTFDALLNMLQVDSSRRDELMNAMGIWMLQMMGMDISVLTYDEVYAFFENELITLNDQAYNFIIGGNFKPEEGPYWYDLLNMLNIDAARKDQLQGAWY